MSDREDLMAALDRMRDVVFTAKDEVGQTGAVSDIVCVDAQAAWQSLFREMTAALIKEPPTEREYFIGCPCMDGVRRCTDRAEWEREKLAHRTTGHQGASAYVTIRPAT